MALLCLIIPAKYGRTCGEDLEKGGLRRGIDFSLKFRQYVRMLRLALCFSIIIMSAPLLAEEADAVPGGINPLARDGNIPRTRWEHLPQSKLWTRAALAALKAHGKPLIRMVPHDIEEWCPAYQQAGERGRRAFWVGFLSALAKHESTYRPTAVGGGGRWYGLLQILPSTARGYKCRAGSGVALKHGPENLSCGIRIMARTVPRDGVVARGMRGVAADWGPLHSRAKRADMMRWTRRQPYCKAAGAVRPRLRPERFAMLKPEK